MYNKEAEKPPYLFFEGKIMKTYTFELVIKEGCDEFWEGIDGPGCNEVYEAIKSCLDDQAWLDRGKLTLKKFENTDD